MISPFDGGEKTALEYFGANFLKFTLACSRFCLHGRK